VTPIVLMVPGSIETRTGGYEYDRRMAAGLRARGCTVSVQELDVSFPHPTAAALDDAAAILAAIPDGTIVVVDGLALGAMPAEIEREACRLRLVALVHMPLADESGLDPVAAARLHDDEGRALGAAALVVATSERTADALASDGLPRTRIAIVEPGTDPAPIARGSGDPSAVHLVCVATLGPGKGHEILVRALGDIPRAGWRLTCAGSVDRYPAIAHTVRDRLRLYGLNDRVSLVGELDGPAVTALYDRADVFVLPTLHESYGMAVAEALGRGLPIVSTTTGAISALVGGDAGILVAPGDAAALSRALRSIVADRLLRARLAGGARRARTRLRSWECAAEAMASVLATL
jgi:glycosyltransferase involved in cell wall biosynthesis